MAVHWEGVSHLVLQNVCTLGLCFVVSFDSIALEKPGTRAEALMEKVREDRKKEAELSARFASHRKPQHSRTAGSKSSQKRPSVLQAPTQAESVYKF
eukprot:21775-Amphidinium_carterae.1